MMKNINKTLGLIFTACFILVLSACGGSSGSDNKKQADKVLTGLSITPSSVSIILSQTQALTATATYDNNSTENVTSSVTWVSSDKAIAMVSTSGIITSVAVGNATITASLSGKKASSDISVKANVLKSLTVEPADVSIDIEQTLNLIAKATYADNSTVDVTGSVSWISSNDTVAAISDGVITGLSSGGTTITARLSGVEASSDITVSNKIHNLKLFISANDGIVGQELFVTDGTSDGTSLVKNINTNASSGPYGLTVVNGVGYFVASDGLTGFELWKTNGTTGGTVMVKDIVPGSDSSYPSYLTAVGSTLYFSADDGITGEELWMSDGSSAGTVMVKDIYTGSDPFFGENSSNPRHLTAVGNTLYFTANDGSNGQELWKSDGSSMGTAMVKNIATGPNSSLPVNLTAVGSALYFSAVDNTNGRELWKSDGTAMGTRLISDINPGTESSSPSPVYLTSVGNVIYFSADDGITGFELWKTDGTTAGTVLVKDIATGPNSSYPFNLTTVGNTLYFSADDDSNGEELWKSDGTTAGTVMVKDIYPGQNSRGFAKSSAPSNFAAVGNALYFSANDGSNGEELWKSDGTTAGTVMVKDIYPGQNSRGFANSSAPSDFTVAGNTLYFSANDGSNGEELWISDGSVAGTRLLRNINPRSGSSSPQGITVIGDIIYFSAYDGTSGVELWRSDGTTDGTFLLADISQVGGDSNPRWLTKIGAINYFVANNGIASHLWRTDGTTTGTFLIKDIAITRPLTTVGSTLYFTASDDTHGTELWKSDGTTIGTVLVKDIETGKNSSGLLNLTAMDNMLYFVADDGVTGDELWKSDGTTAGTILVKDIQFGANSSFPSNPTVMDGKLYFSADDGLNGHELWKTDGTTAGTVMVKDIYPGQNPSGFGNSSSPTHLTIMNGTLYFTAEVSLYNEELWKTDGTAAGTVLVKDIRTGSKSSYPYNLTTVANKLYFSADDGINGRELWKSDGTAIGTVMVKDIYSGQNSDGFANHSDPSDLTTVDSMLYFKAEDGFNGEELWKSDGTINGTVMVKDIYPGQDPGGFANSSAPSDFATVGNTLYFSANDGTNGKELWKSDGTATGTGLVKDFNIQPGSSSNPVALGRN